MAGWSWINSALCRTVAPTCWLFATPSPGSWRGLRPCSGEEERCDGYHGYWLFHHNESRWHQNRLPRKKTADDGTTSWKTDMKLGHHAGLEDRIRVFLFSVCFAIFTFLPRENTMRRLKIIYWIYQTVTLSLKMCNFSVDGSVVTQCRKRIIRNKTIVFNVQIESKIVLFIFL